MLRLMKCLVHYSWEGPCEHDWTYCYLTYRKKSTRNKQDTHDQRSINREFYVGQQVMARNLRPGAAWLPAIVVEQLGPLTYLVEVNGQLWKRHIDHLRVQSDTP